MHLIGADGLHPTVEGQTRIAEAFRDEIVRRYGMEIDNDVRVAPHDAWHPMRWHWPQRRKQSSSCSAVVLQLFLFGPHTIYAGNEAEFTASFWALERPSPPGAARLRRS